MGLEALLGTDDARAVVEIMARIPGSPALRKALLRYCGLFAPASQRLRWGRVEKLLLELVAMMESGRVERNGRTWSAPLDYWQNAFDAVLANANIRRPLKSHGYLLEVLVGQADTVEAKVEVRTEQQRRGTAGTGGGEDRAQRTGMPASIKESLRNFALTDQRKQKGATHG
jgi:hypothetical protein